MRKFAFIILVVIFFALIAIIVASCKTNAQEVKESPMKEAGKPENQFTVISTARLQSGTITVGYFNINPKDTIYIMEGYSASYPISIHVK